MVSLKKMKLRKITSFKRTKKGVDPVDVEEEPVPQISSAGSDPIMEEREDAENSTPSPAASAEEPNNENVEDDERTPPEEGRTSPMELDSAIKAGDDGSVMTEKDENEGGDDVLSTVKEEPSKEEAEEKAVADGVPSTIKEHDESLAQTNEEDVTIDTNPTEMPDISAACNSPTQAQAAFCGCFENITGIKLKL
mmetsp:Transcript_38617/g.65967  ORF Transcript_38617/g.65967 Transcript_38617/m.65967 type:complete len:194 (-) Transcript_38617:207-788(-)|eukprot:CAMPEP_0183725972 /NCGR_PEP_ID=MMETSP0737-20130205/22015_1 /TAXON_ID=385413 /ORGANISM="Thalassiosira miniscula, Strain CCMP1093" /LENGTH=193 /DNA_ID=CAMNT_0025957157 /DNA_START=112 /DNA_END=696 /DNA_ORIENTATION=+